MNNSPVLKDADSDQELVNNVRQTIEPKVIIIPKDEELKQLLD